MNQTANRFEFRAWAHDFSNIEDRIRALGQCQRNLSSQEIYIISIKDTEHNIKIRDGYLDVKRLIKTERGLEQWKPHLKEAFPLTASTLMEKVMPVLGQDDSMLITECYTAEDFLEKIVRPKSNLIVVPVHKDRSQCRLPNCAAEIVEVEVDRTTIYSIAIESIDPDVVLELVKRLKLNTYENLNYPAAIKQFLNLKPLC